MAGDIGRVPSDRLVEQLSSLYAGAQRQIVAQINQAVLSGRLNTAARRRAQLLAVLDILDRLGVRADPLARQAVRQAMADGADHTATGIRQLGLHMTSEGERRFASVNADAVAVMQDSLVASLQGARSTVGRHAQDVFAREGRKQVMRALLGAEGSQKTASQRLANELATQGKTGLIDRAGRRWSLQRYADMAVRTVTREAVVQGSLNRMAAHGINLARVSRHANSCTICQPWEGRLFSLDGETSSYQGEPVATRDAMPNSGPPFHPNCRHTVQPVAIKIDQIRRELATATGGA